jgi:hypothetical protein
MISSLTRLCGTVRSPKSRGDNIDSSRRCSSRLHHLRSSCATAAHALGARDRAVASIVLADAHLSTAAALGIALLSRTCIATPLLEIGITAGYNRPVSTIINRCKIV